MASARATPMRWRCPPGELAGETVVVLRVEADELHQLLHPLAAVLLVPYAVDGQRVPDHRARPGGAN